MMKVVISAGPTREKIDVVRFISNRSSGKMGYALAQAAVEQGHQVILVSGPVAITPPAGAELVKVESASEMAAAVKSHAAEADIVIMAAAVADYRPTKSLDGKMKKGEGGMVLELERTEDILLSLGAAKRTGQLLVGFAAETEDLLKNARKKLERKKLDWIIANDVSDRDRGFGSDRNEVTMLARTGRIIKIPLADKLGVAREIFANFNA